MTLTDPRTADPSEDYRAVAWWLLSCCGLVAAIVLVGGATRLTGSGLSIVVWEPIIGVIPPLTEEAWHEAFELYRQFPEYQQRNLGMSLEEFKFIFWWEYWHRILGRLIGVVYFAGFVWFLCTRRLGAALIARLAGLFVLGGLQGALGWYMVTSGLVDEPQVSQYRLTAHLGLAVLIYAFMFWLALDLLRGAHDGPLPPTHARAGTGRAWIWTLIGLVSVTILSGGFVAGTQAGLMFNTFPTMDGQWIPAGILAMQPALINLFENPITIQFTHRVLALLTAALTIACWFAIVRRETRPDVHVAAHILLAAVALQVALGISTLLLQVPTLLAVAHQGGALVLLTAALYCGHVLRPRLTLAPETYRLTV